MLRRRLACIPLVVLAAALSIGGCAVSSKELRVTVTEKGFEPMHAKVAKGQPAVVVFIRKTERTCATEAVFTETGRRYNLPLNEAVRVDLTGIAPGNTVHYACGMDMIKGTITLEQ